MNRALLLPSLALAALLLAACDTADETLMVGTLERDRIELRVEANEPIISIEVADGARVEAGDIVLRQDPARHQARLDQAAAQRDQLAARLAELRRGPREEAIREAQARLAASAVVTRNALADFERAQDIFDRGLSNQASLDSARTRWETAQAWEQADREALAALLHGTTVEELQQAQAALSATEATVAQARLDLERLTVRAPMAGIVDKVHYQLGERPATGATVALLLDDRRSFARIYVPEHLRSRVVPGARLSVTVDGAPAAMPGTVRWVSADASFTPYFALTEHDRSRLSYLAEVDVPAASGLPSGLPAQARPEE
jgi:HlyD family secretion protein